MEFNLAVALVLIVSLSSFKVSSVKKELKDYESLGKSLLIFGGGLRSALQQISIVALIRFKAQWINCFTQATDKIARTAPPCQVSSGSLAALVAKTG